MKGNLRLGKRGDLSSLSLLALCVALLGLASAAAADPADESDQLTRDQVIHNAVQDLLKLQQSDGAWIYQTPDTNRFAAPVQVACTSLACEALMLAAPEDKEVQAAVQRGLEFLFKTLDSSALVPLTSTASKYDLRVWGHCYALDFLCRVRALNAAGEHLEQVNQWIPRLVRALVTEQKPDGGWSYGGTIVPENHHITVTTVPATLALLLARSQGADVPDHTLEGATQALKDVCMETGAIRYHEVVDPKAKSSATGHRTLAGSAGRAVACNTTLLLLGAGSVGSVEFAVDNFFNHWDDLKIRWQKTGTHAGPYAIAPYYFYYAHRYAAVAIEAMPKEKRAAANDRLMETILKTRDSGAWTWNDRAGNARSLGTAFVILALLGDKVSLPPRWRATDAVPGMLWNNF